jgi:hypothetical protein
VDKMPVKNASRRAKIDETTTRAYYNRYNKGKGKVIPQPDLTIIKNKKLYDEHTQFITNLYAQNRDLTNNQVFKAINEAFPGLNVAKSTLLTHIHLRMKDVYKKTATDMGEHTSKLKKHHTQFIEDQIREDPDLSLSKVRLRLLEAYPGLTIDRTTISRQVHLNMEDLYKDNVSAQQNHKRKLFEQHAEFVEELYNDNPDITRIEVYNELMRFFPELKEKNITPVSLHLYLKKALGKWYVEQTRIKEGNPRKLYPEHTKFITELYQNNPDLTVPKGIVAIEKNFPGLTLGKTALHRYLKRCGITEFGMLRRKKRNA